MKKPSTHQARRAYPGPKVWLSSLGRADGTRENTQYVDPARGRLAGSYSPSECSYLNSERASRHSPLSARRKRLRCSLEPDACIQNKLRAGYITLCMRLHAGN